jgi:hypothetical protein
MANLDPWSYAAKTRKEHAEQVALFMWANMARNFGFEAAADAAAYTLPGYAMKRYGGSVVGGVFQPGPVAVPALKWLHAVHNQGHGDAIRGAQAKAEGVKAGVFDIFLPHPIEPLSSGCSYAGFYIELKRKDAGKPSAEQLAYQLDMRAAGYKAEIIHGWELARDAIVGYLTGSN